MIKTKNGIAKKSVLKSNTIFEWLIKKISLKTGAHKAANINFLINLTSVVTTFENLVVNRNDNTKEIVNGANIFTKSHALDVIAPLNALIPGSINPSKLFEIAIETPTNKAIIRSAEIFSVVNLDFILVNESSNEIIVKKRKIIKEIISRTTDFLYESDLLILKLSKYFTDFGESCFLLTIFK